jgi:hypothetical protein
MELVNQIGSDFPKTIDKSKPIYSALIANNNGNAAVQKQIISILKYMKEWTSTPDVYQQTGLMLEKTINFFSYLERFADETEASLKNRFRAIFVRNHDTRWGTPYDVKSVFKQYFPHAEIFLVENVNKIDSTEPGLANLLLDGDIETDTPTDWNLTNCSATADARFSKSYGIEMDQAGGILSQDISISGDKTYFLHFFLKGKINVVIKSDNDKYWDNTDKEWKDSYVNNSFEKEEWNNCSLYFITRNDDSSVTISFEYDGVSTYIDYFRLFAKQPYSSFTVIAHFEGNTSVGAFGLAAGDSDPNIPDSGVTPPQPRYGNYGYYDKSFMSGLPIGFATDIYEDLLDYLKAQGVRAFLDIVIKDAG